MENVRHTLDIFKRLVETMPPLVPKEVQGDMKAALEQCTNNLHLTLTDLEDTMVSFGKKIWPYREAFLELYRLYEGELGEQFLLRRLSKSAIKKFQDFQQSGGTFRDLYSGAPANFFTLEERGELCRGLIETQGDLDQYARQAVVSRDEKKYKSRIVEFEKIFMEVEKQLNDLLLRAEKEQEHPELSAEIREHVRGFEYSFCLLAPKLNYEAVCQSAGFFDERKKHKKTLQTYV